MEKECELARIQMLSVIDGGIKVENKILGFEDKSKDAESLSKDVRRIDVIWEKSKKLLIFSGNFLLIPKNEISFQDV